MKKLLMITRNFPPLVGGMERLNKNIHKILCKHYEVTLIGPAGCRQHANSERVYEFPALPLWRYLVVSILKSIWVGRGIRSDIVFCGSGAAIIAGFFAAKISSARLVCYLHGLDIVAENKLYQHLFLPLIKKSDIVLVNSRHTYTLALAVGIENSKIKVLNPGVDLPDLSSADNIMHEFRRKYKLDAKPVLLIAGRVTERKGIPEFICHAMPHLISVFPGIQLLVVGSEANNSIKKTHGVMQKIEKLVASMGLRDHVHLLGGVSDEVLSAAYIASDLMIFPILNLPGDVEGFGMVAVEAAAHGLPTIAFSVGGVSDAIEEGVSGSLVNEGNYNLLIEKIVASLTPVSEYDSVKCIEHAKNLSWDKVSERLNKYLTFGDCDER